MDVSTTAIIGQRLLRGHASPAAIRELEHRAWPDDERTSHADAGDDRADHDRHVDHDADADHRRSATHLTHTPVPWIPPTSVTEEVDVALGFARATPHEDRSSEAASGTNARALERAIEKYREFS